jgi:hypothetical protein
MGCGGQESLVTSRESGGRSPEGDSPEGRTLKQKTPRPTPRGFISIIYS